jgi:hypothetical protein
MVGYDLDGTICEKLEFSKEYGTSYFKATGEERRRRKEAKNQHVLNAKLVRKPEEQDYTIITAL